MDLKQLSVLSQARVCRTQYAWTGPCTILCILLIVFWRAAGTSSGAMVIVPL